MCRTAEFVAGRQLKSGGMNSELATNYRSVLDNVFRLCNKAGFDVKCLEADSEFKPLLEPLQDELNMSDLGGS